MPRIAEAARRDQIVAAGLACFARAGCHVATMADVAPQAGVSKGIPYLYFDSKQALFLALHEQWDCGAGLRVDAPVRRLPPQPRHRRGDQASRVHDQQAGGVLSPAVGTPVSFHIAGHATVPGR